MMQGTVFMSSRLVMLGRRRPVTDIVANALRARFGDFPVIYEEGVSGFKLARQRANRLGYIQTAGQILFIRTIARWLKISSRPRIAEIERQYSLDTTPVTRDVHYVRSINDQAVIDLLQAIRPEIVVIFGTRIIGQSTLNAVPARFLNMHAGITPGFHGSHGAYWALATGHPELAGVTIHRVDSGIDTGGILKQARIEIGPRDNFITYSYLQLAAGLPLLLQAVDEALCGEVREEPLSGHLAVESHLYHHPTIWSYLAGCLHGTR